LSPQRQQILKGKDLMTGTEQAQGLKQTQEDGRHGWDHFPPATTSSGMDRFLANYNASPTPPKALLLLRRT
jgi:hypothetical protein